MTRQGKELMSRALRHRLRNSASGIKAATALLAGQLESRLTPSEREYFPLIAKECDALAEVASRLSLLLEGVQCGSPGQVDQIIEQACQNVQAQYPLVEINFMAKCRSVAVQVADGSALLVALKEIIRNAAEASADRRIGIRYSSTKNSVEIIVNDHGAGIPPAVWPGALEPFRVPRPGHLGIGLAVANAAVEAMGGQFVAEKNEDGFCVVLKLPCMKRD